MQRNILIVCGIFALCLVNSANAIKCYQCKSTLDPACAKEAIDSNSFVRQVECDSMPKPAGNEQYMPVTKCNRVVTSDKAGQIVSRDCHFQQYGVKDDVCKVSHSLQVLSCHTCSGDLCNNSSSAGRFMAFGLAAIVALVSMQFAF